MKYVLAILLFVLCHSCRDTDPTVTINSAELQARSNNFSFKLNYLGNDNTRFAGVSYADSLHVYKLKSVRMDEYENFIIGVYSNNYAYAIDSSTDGGHSWSIIPQVIELKYTKSTLNTERIAGFFVSNGGYHKYIVSTECIYYSINNAPFQQFRIDNKGKSCFYDRDKDMILIFDQHLPTTFPGTFLLKAHSNNNQFPFYFYQDVTGGVSYLQLNNKKIAPDTTFAGPIFRTLQARGVDEYKNFRVFYPEKFFPQYRMTLSMNEVLKGDTTFPGINYYTTNGEQGFISDTSFNLPNNYRLFFSNTSSEIILLTVDNNIENRGSEAYHAVPVPTSEFSSLHEYTIQEQPQFINISIGIKKGTIRPTKMKLKLFAASLHNDTNFHKLIPLDIAFTPNSDSSSWKGSFWPGKLKLQKGDQYKIMIYFADHTKEERFFIQREFIPESIVTRYYKWILLLAIFMGYLVTITITWRFFPLKLLFIYQKLKIEDWSNLFGEPVNTVLKGIQLIFPLSVFANTRHVYNAWMRRHGSIINDYFNQLHSVKERNSYIPIPLVYQPPGETTTISENHPVALPQTLNSQKRQLIQVIGEGGIGKTTLAIQICRWLIYSENHKKGYQSIFMVDTATTDIITTVLEKFSLWLPDERISPSFIYGLLKNKNLILLIDALSEGSESMQDYVNRIHSRVPVNAMVVTSRFKHSFQELPCTYFYPQSLDTQSLLFFVNSYTENIKNPQTNGQLNNVNNILTEPQKLNFTAKVISIIQDNIEYRISPAHVKIIINDFLRSFNPAIPFDTFLTKIPENIQDVYYHYLESTNPVNNDATNYLPKEYLIKVVELLGSISLDENYIPKDIEKGLARNRLSNELPYIKADALQRLIDNNIIFEQERLGTYQLRFNLDSMAEVTAAKYFYLKHLQAGDLEEFTQMVTNLNHANGFKVAFLRVLSKMSC